MTQPVSPFEANPPSSARLWKSVAIAVVGAAVVLVAIVLPAEYNIDPTRIGGVLGLTGMSEPTRTLEIKNVIGGNEAYREVEIPDVGEPIPLPNPAVSQIKTEPPKTQTVTVTLEPGQETEIKTVLSEAQVILYTWKAEGGEVYTDFHGHEPNTGTNDFVRYEEQQSGTGGNGSLVAPFTGEHGWFWLNISETPVTITLTFSGYYDDYIDYGLL